MQQSTDRQEPARALRGRLARGPALLLDGALGTELERRGCPAGLPLWSTHALLEAPERVAEIHGDYARAGAEILTANTFRTQQRTLERATASGRNLGARDAELTQLAVDLARTGAASVDRPVWIAGSAPPLEDCYRPDRVPGDEALEREHSIHMGNLGRAGVDLVLIETMNSLREAAIASRIAREAGLPFLVSFTSWNSARLLSGERLEEAVWRVLDHEPLAVLVNCLPASAVAACLPALQGSGLPFGVYANLGEPTADGTFRRSEEHGPEEFAAHARRWIEAGARIVGGCCGTTPDHIRAADHVRAAG